MIQRISLLLLVGAVVDLHRVAGDNVVDGVYYTAFDSASWAVTSEELSPVLGKDKQALYDDFIDGCNLAVFKGNQTDMEINNQRECAFQDGYRLRMNREQPSSVYNYTKKGYEKIRAPSALMDVILEFWNENKEKAVTEWKDINVYHNAWEAPVRVPKKKLRHEMRVQSAHLMLLISFEFFIFHCTALQPTIVHLNQRQTGGSQELQQKVWDLVQPVLEEWTGQHLSPVSLYGIRLYHNNSILAPHVSQSFRENMGGWK